MNLPNWAPLVAAEPVPRNIVIFDVDNCISDTARRAHLAPRSDIADNAERARAWERFHLASFDDAARNLDLVNVHAQRNSIVFFTAMPFRYHPMREDWLNKNGVPRWLTFYRPDSDLRRSVEVKRDMLAALTNFLDRGPRVFPWSIVAAYDDRRDIVDMYEEHGITARRVSINGEDL